MNLAWLDIEHKFFRFVLTVAGVSMLFMGMMGEVGMYRGLVHEAMIIIEDVGADLWVTQGGRAGPFGEDTTVPGTLERRLEGVPGVVWARKFIHFSEQFEIGERRLRMCIVGLDYPADTGSWIPLVAGRGLYSGHYEAIADRSLGFPLGSHFRIARDVYTVVGITSGQVDMGGDGILFVSILDSQTIRNNYTSEALLLQRARARAVDPQKDDNSVAAIMAKLKPGTDVDRVKHLIQSWGDVAGYTKQEQEQILLDTALWRLRLQILVFVIMTILVTVIILGLLLYTMTMEKRQDIALLKLIGASDGFIMSMIVQQAMLIGVAGFIIGYLFGQLLFPHFPRTVLLLRNDLIGEAFIGLMICLVGSLFGIRKSMSIRAGEVLS
jgi:putative ABC transport system permease protein